MQTGKIGVTSENLFPIIKKFLYSDHDIFLREIISNAVDASQKLRTLASKGEYNGDVTNLKVKVKLDKEAKTITVSDNGIGMTADEIEKYINQIAFSGANEFLEKYKNDANAIIGHFGLGFYSSFMVSGKVEILTKSYKEGAEAVKWSCDGTPEYSIANTEKDDTGTDIIMYINNDSEEFLEEDKIEEILNKYCKFLPIPVLFGKKKDWKEGKQVETDEDNQINDTQPAWTKSPSDLKDEDYQNFYRQLYPMVDEPLFNIHLNVDYPFNLTGILYFPKLTNDMSIQKDKIQLYQNQVFVTDNVEGIVPEFLTLLRGVIDSPDIPLNVSRSYLQADGAVKKISSYITRKVADKLKSLFNNDRKGFEEKWDDIKIVIEYGMLTEDRFYDRAKDFTLYPTVDKNYFTFDELKDKIKDVQTDKDDTLIILYASNKEEQHAYIESAKEKGYEVLLLDSPIIAHVLQKLETQEEKISFVRVDSDHIDNLIKKDEAQVSKLSDEEKETLKTFLDGVVPKEKFTVQLEALDSTASPFIITEPEFMRRMKDMQQTGGGGMFGMGNFPEMYNLVVNTNHELVGEILNTKTDKKKTRLVNQALDLAKLGKNLLKGEELTEFIKRSYEMIK